MNEAEAVNQDELRDQLGLLAGMSESDLKEYKKLLNSSTLNENDIVYKNVQIPKKKEKKKS